MNKKPPFVADVDLTEVEARVSRMLDGMSFNREVAARDTRALLHEVKGWRARHAAAEGPGPTGRPDGFSEKFSDLFKPSPQR